VVVDGLEPAGGARGAERVLFKTSNSRLWERDSLREDAVELDGKAARAFVATASGWSGSTTYRFGDEEAHRVLLGAGVVAVESLDLRRVEPGPYQLVCAPLKLVGSDSAGTRPAPSRLVPHRPGRDAATGRAATSRRAGPGGGHSGRKRDASVTEVVPAAVLPGISCGCSS
jgi:hypothetical protein